MNGDLPASLLRQAIEDLRAKVPCDITDGSCQHRGHIIDRTDEGGTPARWGYGVRTGDVEIIIEQTSGRWPG